MIPKLLAPKSEVPLMGSHLPLLRVFPVSSFYRHLSPNLPKSV